MNMAEGWNGQTEEAEKQQRKLGGGKGEGELC